MRRVNYKIIAEKAGLSHSMVRKIMCGVRKPSMKSALKLENATGIEAPAWIFPERYNLKDRVRELAGQIND